MRSLNKRFRRLNSSSAQDMAEYESILNDPLCSVTEKEVVKEVTKIFNDEGKLAEIMEVTYFLVHYTQRDM